MENSCPALRPADFCHDSALGTFDEPCTLEWLDAPIDKLWVLNDNKNKAQPTPNPEKAQPRNEVTAATLLRAVYSRWPLREVLTDFWHNHFNVNAQDNTVSIVFPVYDRDIIRPN